MRDWDPSGKVDVLDVLDVLEIDNIRREGLREARFSCPYPGHDNGDQSASAYMNLETTAWFCHGCKRKGNVVGFAASMLGISPMKAKRLLRQAYDPSSLNPDERNITQELHEFFAKKKALPIPENTEIDADVLEQLAVDWALVEKAMPDVPQSLAYMLERGFSSETLAYWDFGYHARSDRITFAVRDEHGALIGFKGRAWDDRHPKYVVLGDNPGMDPRDGFPRYYTGSIVFGLHEAIRNSDGELIVCEGELNAIALWQMGHRNAVALNGSYLTDPQLRLIREHADTAIFYFDPDKAGQEGLWGRDDEDTGEHHPGALEKLTKDLTVAIVGHHDDDPAEMLRQGRKDDVLRAIGASRPYTQVALARRMGLTV